jgi:transcriptional regulator with XRE-family HTH domain
MSVRGGADGDFGVLMREFGLASGLSLRRLGQRVHCSHGYLWELEAGSKRPSAQIADLVDTALGADGRLSAAARRVSADTGGHRRPPAA